MAKAKAEVEPIEKEVELNKDGLMPGAMVSPAEHTKLMLKKRKTLKPEKSESEKMVEMLQSLVANAK